MGGWFIVERFINPSFFSMADPAVVKCEWSYCQYFKNNETALNKLRNHWDTFVTEDDMRAIAASGITHLRVPIGYWALLSQEELESRNEPFLTGQMPYLERAVKWMKKYNLKAIIDLHGAPGGQNGFDNSGHDGVLDWGKGDTINRTLDIIERLSLKILDFEACNKTSGVVVGLELLNEAATFSSNLYGGVETVKSYYKQAYSVARKYLPANKYTIVIEGAFKVADWVNFMSESEYENVQLDLHIYHCFDEGLRRAPYSAHLDITCNIDGNQLAMQTLPTFIGEWSAAWKVESNFAAGEPYPNAEEQAFMRQFILAQMHTYDSWYWWNFKTENAPMWDLFVGLQGGWFPTTPSNEVAGACANYTTTH
jgi:glucan 1,3-beta-glucosidase